VVLGRFLLYSIAKICVKHGKNFVVLGRFWPRRKFVKHGKNFVVIVRFWLWPKCMLSFNKTLLVLGRVLLWRYQK